MLLGSLALAYVIWVVVAVGGLLSERRSPTATLAWSFAFVALPVVSGVFFLVFGPLRLRRRRRRYANARNALRGLTPAWEAAEGLEPAAAALARVGARLGQGAPRPAEAVTLLPDGDAALDAIEGAIGAATHHVHCEYYIWDTDAVGTRVRDALVTAARRGVEVRVVYDAIGSGADAAFFKPLVDAGGKAREFNPTVVWRLRMANFRTHRKIVVCDGTVAFCGGNNLHDPISAKVSGDTAWRDLHVRVQGEAAHDLQRVFLENWLFAGGKFNPGDALARYFPTTPRTDDQPLVQVLASGPDGDDFAIYMFVLAALATARRRVWIQTPYLVPDEVLERSLLVAVLRGVDVHILVPAHGDNLLVNAASRTWCESLQRGGVRIHMYTPRMLHAKALLVDDDVGVVGTANMDNRSFRLNFEVMVACYDRGFTAELADRFEADSAAGRPFQGRGRSERTTSAFESAARLFAPLL